MKKRIVANPFNMILSGLYMAFMLAYGFFKGAWMLPLGICLGLWCLIQWLMNTVSLKGDELAERQARDDREKAMTKILSDPATLLMTSIPPAMGVPAFATANIRLEESRKLIPASWAVVLGAGLLMAILIEDSLGNARSVDIGKYGFLFALIFLGFALDLAVSSFRGKKRSGL